MDQMLHVKEQYTQPVVPNMNFPCKQLLLE